MMGCSGMMMSEQQGINLIFIIKILKEIRDEK
jgi:hypothetical protein